MNLGDRLKTSFPAGIPLPAALSALASWSSSHAQSRINGHFRIETHNAALLPDWLGEKAASLARFGGNGDGSWFGLWKFGDGEFPVVFVYDSGAEVVAPDAKSFLILLAIGYHPLGHKDMTKPPEEDLVEEHATRAYREWVAGDLGLCIPNVGEEIAGPARKQFGDFWEWYKWPD